MTWFPHYAWRIFCLDLEFWVESSFLLVLGKYCVTSFWHALFLMRNPLSFKKKKSPLLERCHFSLAGFKDLFSFVFMFQQFDYDVSLFEFLWVYPVWGFGQLLESVSFCIKFGEFSALFLGISIFVGKITRSRTCG